MYILESGVTYSPPSQHILDTLSTPKCPSENANAAKEKSHDFKDEMDHLTVCNACEPYIIYVWKLSLICKVDLRCLDVASCIKSYVTIDGVSCIEFV